MDGTGLDSIHLGPHLPFNPCPLAPSDALLNKQVNNKCKVADYASSPQLHIRSQLNTLRLSKDI